METVYALASKVGFATLEVLGQKIHVFKESLIEYLKRWHWN